MKSDIIPVYLKLQDLIKENDIILLDLIKALILDIYSPSELKEIIELTQKELSVYE